MDVNTYTSTQVDTEHVTRNTQYSSLIFHPSSFMSHLFIYGSPGTGKSTIGKLLALNLNLPFVDLDRVIESDAGMSIPQIMEGRGESAFRDLETAALKKTVGETENVIALGGGALLRNENRALVESSGKVILLMAELDTLIERLAADSTKRPLLAGDLREKLSSLLATRAEHYNSFPLRLRVDGKSADENAWQAQIAFGRFRLSAMGEYDVIVQPVEQIANLLRRRGPQNPIVVTDENVAKFHAETVLASLCEAGYQPNLLTIPAGEANKTFETVNRLWRGFLDAGLDRKSTIIALGGGVVGDLAGFAASTFMRGVDWVVVPTSLLAMADASLGGKTGFDLPEGKNLVGAFHPPKLVLADPQVLKTLPETEFISGMAEVVKHGIIADPELFRLCSRGRGVQSLLTLHRSQETSESVTGVLEEIIKRAMAVKIKIIEEDPYEKGLRAVLNLGHTVGHAVELVSGFNLRHGEAIAIGMAAEAKLSAKLGLAASGLSDAIAESLSALGLPVRIPNNLPRGEIVRAMRVDKKKSADAVRFALPIEIGKVGLIEVTDLESALD